MKILVCGGRDYRNYEKLSAVLNELHRVKPITFIVNGGATGADRMSSEWGHFNCIQVIEYPAQWTLHGKAAGPKRNQHMLNDNDDIELVVAFPGGSGTKDMIERAAKKSIAVMYA